jgi:hypothetical protein
MQELQEKYRAEDIVWLTINSTNPDHRDYLSAKARSINVKDWNYNPKFMLADPKGKVGKLYRAKTTPHMFIIDRGKLVYQGAIDDNGDAYSNPKEDKNYVTAALEEILAGKEVTQTLTKPYGCSVKYP